LCWPACAGALYTSSGSRRAYHGKEFAGRTPELSLERCNISRNAFIATVEGHVGNGLPLFEQRQGMHQAQPLPPLTVSKARFPQEQTAERLARHRQPQGPVVQR